VPSRWRHLPVEKGPEDDTSPSDYVPAQIIQVLCEASYRSRSLFCRPWGAGLCAPPPPPSSFTRGGDSFRLIDDLLFVFQCQHLAAAVGEIDDKIAVPSHDARK